MENTHILDKIRDISQDREKEEFSPIEMSNTLLSLLKAREAQILKLRYGLDVDKPQTLAEIGQKLNLTRERIRQLEKQAIKNITQHPRHQEITTPLRHLTTQLLEKYGGLMLLELIGWVYYLVNRMEVSLPHRNKPDFQLS